MRIILSILALNTILLFTSCKSKSQFTPLTFAEDMIVFGNSGGFAGTTTSYTILNNGQFFKNISMGDAFTALKNVKKKTAKQLFNNYGTLGIDKMDFNDPGNLTYFIEFKNGNSTKRLAWGGGQKVPENLKLYYRNLMQMAKSQGITPSAEK